MFAKERQDLIFKMLQQDGAVTTPALVEEFKVSIETIRRDLLTMEEQGLLSRVHGGAVALGEMKPFSSLRQRNQEHNDGKNILAQKAVEMVAEGDIIGIDSGSTAIFFADALKKKFSKLTVVTHSADVFESLRNHGDFEVILCGGHYLKGENAFYGPLVLQSLEQLHVQKAFICPSAISLEFGIGDYQQELYQVQQKILANAGQVFILADSSKFEKKALLKLSSMKREYCYITDDSLSETLRQLYLNNEIRVF